MAIPIDSQTALIVVDVQKDFCPGGSLAVPQGDEVVPIINQYIRRFKERGAPVFATRDWHPENHSSFKENNGPWPRHCVQGTPGSEFHPDLRLPAEAEVVSKATNPKEDAYSGFEGTDLAKRLRAKRIRKVFVGGLATDYCVKSTVLDALKAGFETCFLADASRGVDVKPGDSDQALREMLARGAKSIRFEDLSPSEKVTQP